MMIRLNGNKETLKAGGKGVVSRSTVLYLSLGWVILIFTCLILGLLYTMSSPLGASLSATELVLISACVLVTGVIGLPLILISSIAFFYSILLAAAERIRPPERSPALVRSRTDNDPSARTRF